MSGSFLEAISILEKIRDKHLKLSENFSVTSKEFNESWVKYHAMSEAVGELQAAHEHELNEMAKHYERIDIPDHREGWDSEQGESN